MKTSVALLFALGAVQALPALAQPSDGRPPAGESVFDGDYVTIGIGGSYSPSYDGSDDYDFSVLPIITGSVADIEFTPRGPGLAFDFVPDRDGAKVDLVLGAVVTASFDRVNDIKDPVVEQLGELDLAIEIGPIAGVQVNRVLSPFDSLTAAVDVKWDVAGAHNGMLVVPRLSYFTPVSRGAAVRLAISAEYVDDDFADYYFSITPTGNAASGLPVFDADGGWKNLSFSLFSGVDLDGDVTNGGLSLFLIGGYTRLLGDAKRSPVTSIRGDADQWFGAVGLGYTF